MKNIIDSINVYYESIKKEFVESRYYVEWDTQNLATSSLAYEKMLLTIGDEFSTYITEFTRKIDIQKGDGIKNKNSIRDFIDYAESDCKCLFKKSLIFKPTHWIVLPFNYFKEDGKREKPKWWDKYIALKHNRLRNNELVLGVTLEDVLFSFAALTLVKECIIHDNCPLDLSELSAEATTKTCSRTVSSDMFSILVSKDFYIHSEYYVLNMHEIMNQSQYNNYIGGNNEV